VTDEATDDLAVAEAAQAESRACVAAARAAEARSREALAQFRSAVVWPSPADLARMAAIETRLAATAKITEAESAKADAAERHLDALRAQRPLAT
jgi:hypothetical protein